MLLAGTGLTACRWPSRSPPPATPPTRSPPRRDPAPPGAASSGMDLSTFLPPACPYRSCSFHRRDPPLPFFWRAGHYRTHRPDRSPRPPIPRFRCRSCYRYFSSRTFSVDFRFRHPELTPWALEQLVSSVSLRQASRLGRLSRAALERRLVRYGLHCRRLLRWASRTHLRRRLPGPFFLDEAESFEGSRLRAPLTVPMAIEGESRYTVAFAVGTLRPRIPRKDPRWRPSARLDRSRVVVGRCLAEIAAVAVPGAEVLTDQKPGYRAWLRSADPKARLRHEPCSGKLPRGKENPLFPINHLLAMARDGLSRLRRRTWCASKRRARLWLHLSLYVAWKNFVRVRFNGERYSAAQHAGVTRRRWRIEELAGGRLDLGPASLAVE